MLDVTPISRLVERRPSRRGVSRNVNCIHWDHLLSGRPSRRGVSRNTATKDYFFLLSGRPSRRGVSRNYNYVGRMNVAHVSPLPQGRE